MKNLFRNLTLLIVTITLLASCGSKEMKKAKEYMDAQMYSDAISLLKIEIQDSPKNAEASFLLGKCYLELNEDSKAKEVFKRAILLNTDYKNKVGKIYFDLALNSCKESSFRKANLFYNEAIKYDPTGKEKFSENLYNYGNEKSTSSTNADDVIEILDNVVRINPSYKEKTADLTYNLAVSFIEKGFVDDGFQYAKFSIKNDPKHIKDISDLYFNYATSLLSIPDKKNESVGYFNEAIKLNKELENKVAEKYKTTAKECESNDKIQEALFFARNSAELNSENELYYKELKIKYKPKIPVDGLAAYFPFDKSLIDNSSNNIGIYSKSNISYSNNRHNDLNKNSLECNNTSVIIDNKFDFAERTVSFWLEVEEFPYYDYQVVLSNDGNKYQKRYGSFGCVLDKNNTIKLQSSGSNWYTVKNANKFEWYFITLVKDNNKIKYYLNGKLLSTDYADNGCSNSSDGRLRIGVHRDGIRSHSSFKGKVDDLRIYNRVLTDDEIVSLYKE